MAVLRASETGPPPVPRVVVPAELRDPGHRTWQEPRAYSRWCSAHKVDDSQAEQPWTWRYNAALVGWALGQGLTTERLGVPDRFALAALGLRQFTPRQKLTLSGHAP